MAGCSNVMPVLRTPHHGNNHQDCRHAFVTFDLWKTFLLLAFLQSSDATTLMIERSEDSLIRYFPQETYQSETTAAKNWRIMRLYWLLLLKSFIKSHFFAEMIQRKHEISNVDYHVILIVFLILEWKVKF